PGVVDSARAPRLVTEGPTHIDTHQVTPSPATPTGPPPTTARQPGRQASRQQRHDNKSTRGKHGDIAHGYTTMEDLTGARAGRASARLRSLRHTLRSRRAALQQSRNGTRSHSSG